MNMAIEAHQSGMKANRVDLDQRPAQKACDLHGRARGQICTEALAAHAIVFAVFVEPRQPRRNANDVVERAADGTECRLDLIDAPV